ncbi:MAG: solute carrier family 26 protein [Aquificaceae bacterium]|nr:solute carrier family 26 protein [Aquificaceae bacterium]MDW8097554.1 solute carrier family 26 protein [Aquificaceae bacterium]
MDRFLPFLRWIRGYDGKTFSSDLIAGLTVAVVLVPQSMAYALIAGLPPVYGLYAASIPVIVAALFGSSAQLATGPVAIVAFLTYVSLSSFAKPGEEKFIQLAILMAFLVGLIQLALGIFRLGFLVNFVSHSVIVGFTNAAAIIIMTTQIPALLGIKIEQKELIFQNLYEIFTNLPKTNFYTLAVGLTSIALIVGLRRVNKNFPSALFAVALFTALSYFFSFESHGIRVVGEIPQGLPLPSLPTIDLELLDSITGKAFIVALVGFMEAYAIAKFIASQTKQKVDVNQELVGQGLANLVGSFFKSFPVSGSFSRSAVNFQAGAKTGMANIISASFVIATIFFVAPLLYYLPRAVLSAVVITAVVSLVKPKYFLHLWKTNRYDGISAITTFALSFITKPDYAIFIGMFLSLSLFLWRSLYPRIVRMSRDPVSKTFVNAESNNIPTCPQIEMVRPEASFYYANTENILEEIKSISEQKPALKHLVIDCESVNYMDGTALDALVDFLEDLRRRGINLVFVNVKGPVEEVMRRSGFLDKLGRENILPSKGYALGYLFKSIDHGYCAQTCPYALFNECYTVKDYVKFEPAPSPLKDLYEELSSYEDIEIYAGKAYRKLILKADSMEFELKADDFYTDGKGIFLPSTRMVKIREEFIPLGSLCLKKDFTVKNGFVYLGNSTGEMVNNLIKIFK